LRPKTGLNPKLWHQGGLRSEVADALKRVADQFLKEIDADISVKDVIMTGSQAASTWDSESDIDLHVIADLSEFGDPEDVMPLFKAVKTAWNQRHDVTIYGIPVEVFIEDSNNPPPEVTGRWSLVRSQWILPPPDHGDDSFEVDNVMDLVKKHSIHISSAMKSRDPSQIESVLDEISSSRKDGIVREGELAPENIAYRVLRRMGRIQKAWDLFDSLTDKSLSVQ
jgi:predicted nucleotidyltransferase